jgi:hypothetical protein
MPHSLIARAHWIFGWSEIIAFKLQSSQLQKFASLRFIFFMMVFDSIPSIPCLHNGVLFSKFAFPWKPPFPLGHFYGPSCTLLSPSWGVEISFAYRIPKARALDLSFCFVSNPN